MDRKKLTQRLADLENSIRQLRLELIGDAPKLPNARTPEQINDLVNRGICLRCGEPIIDGESVSRGVHERCMQKIRRDKSVEEAEMLGFLLPVGKRGPKSKPALDIVSNAVTFVESARRSNKKESVRNTKNQ